MGVVVPKNIPMKEAKVRSSYDLEHLKGVGIQLLGKVDNEIICFTLSLCILVVRSNIYKPYFLHRQRGCKEGLHASTQDGQG